MELLVEDQPQKSSEEESIQESDSEEEDLAHTWQVGKQLGLSTCIDDIVI